MDEELYTRLLKYIEKDNLSEEERIELENWIKKSRDGNYLDQLKEIHMNKNLARFQQDMKRANSDRKQIRFTSRTFFYFSRIAAAVLVILVTSAIIYLTEFRTRIDINQVRTASKITEVTLSDGTTIDLNRGSVLSYPEKLHSSKREVFLSGEAFFNVTKNKRSPFIVHMERTNVRVLGTSFNIKESEQGSVLVHVITGKVVFSEEENRRNRIELLAGQEGIFEISSHKFVRENYTSENFLFWKTGKLNFDDQVLSTVFGELGESFGKIIVAGDEDILQNKLTSNCEGQKLEDILDELSILFHLEYKTKGDTVLINKSP